SRRSTDPNKPPGAVRVSASGSRTGPLRRPSRATSAPRQACAAPDTARRRRRARSRCGRASTGLSPRCRRRSRTGAGMRRADAGRAQRALGRRVRRDLQAPQGQHRYPRRKPVRSVDEHRDPDDVSATLTDRIDRFQQRSAGRQDVIDHQHAFAAPQGESTTKFAAAAGLSAVRVDRALTVIPSKEGGGAVRGAAEPEAGGGEVFVDVIRVGIDGTDSDIARGQYGTAPQGSEPLVIGHEALGRVERGAGSLVPGTLVVASVRRPDGCPNCTRGEADMCLWGTYKERGIVGLHGYCAERYAERPEYLFVIKPELAGP